MKRTMRLIVMLALVTPAPAARAFDFPFLPLGSDAKTHLGAGAVTSVGASSILYNPANLAADARGTEAFAELSVVSLRHRYEMPDAGRTRLQFTTPVPLAGASVRLARRWTLGVVALAVPAGGPPVEARHVPSRQLGEDPVFLDVKSDSGSRASSLLALGGAYRALESLALGISVARYQISSGLSVADTESGEALGGIETVTTRIAPRLGVRWLPLALLAIGAAVEAASRPKLAIRGTGEGGSSAVERGKRGSRATLGMQIRFGAVRPFAEVQMAQSAADRGSASDLLAPPDAEPSRHDTLSAVVGSHLKVGGSWTALLSAGWFPSPVGDGVMAERASDGVERRGAAFGDLEVVSRQGLGIGLRQQGAWGRLSCGLARQWGKRDVPESSRGYGRYDLEVFYAGCEIGKRF